MSNLIQASAHAGVLDYLGGIKLPEDRGPIALDWSDTGSLGLVKKNLLGDHNFCPCEALANDDRFGMEVQHHDGLLGLWNGPAGNAFGSGLANQGNGYNNMQALIGPNLPPPVRAMIITKVGTFNLPRVLQLWGAAQEGLARAIVDAWENGWFPSGYHRSHVLVTGIFIHPFAGLVPLGKDEKWDHKKFLDGEKMADSMFAIFSLTYLAGIGMLSDALTGGLTPEERVDRAKTTTHLFRGFKAKVKDAPAA